MANDALLSSLSYLLRSLWYIFLDAPMGCTITSLICVDPKDFTGHTYLVLHQVKRSTTNVIF